MASWTEHVIVQPCHPYNTVRLHLKMNGMTCNVILTWLMICWGTIVFMFYVFLNLLLKSGENSIKSFEFSSWEFVQQKWMSEINLLLICILHAVCSSSLFFSPDSISRLWAGPSWILRIMATRPCRRPPPTSMPATLDLQKQRMMGKCRVIPSGYGLLCWQQLAT